MRQVYRSICMFVCLFAWVPVISNPSFYHGGSLLQEIMEDAGIVLGTYCALELVRSSKEPERFAWLVFLMCYGGMLIISLFGTALMARRLLGI